VKTKRDCKTCSLFHLTFFQISQKYLSKFRFNLINNNQNVNNKIGQLEKSQIFPLIFMNDFLNIATQGGDKIIRTLKKIFIK